MREEEDEADGEAEGILIGRFSLQVEDGGGEAADRNACRGSQIWSDCWLAAHLVSRGLQC